MKTAISKRTRGFKVKHFIFSSLSFLCNYGLVIGFFIYAMIGATETTRYSIAMTGFVGIVVSLVSAICKKHWRTPLVIMLVGLFFATKKYATVLIIIGVAIVLDEMIFAPLAAHYKSKASINVEIDKRGIA